MNGSPLAKGPDLRGDQLGTFAAYLVRSSLSPLLKIRMWFNDYREEYNDGGLPVYGFVRAGRSRLGILPW